jgi:tRNA threonylcarbamoyl adenosine modification protein YeaZ
VAVGTGPGPFTGLRVGLVSARTLAATLGVAVHGVCTLGVLALQALESGAVGSEPFLVATDARRREVYWAQYAAAQDDADSLLPQRVRGPEVSLPADLPVQGLRVVGRGADLYPDALGERVGPLDPAGGSVAALALRSLRAGLDVADTSPRYLRRPDVHEGGGHKSVLG